VIKKIRISYLFFFGFTACLYSQENYFGDVAFLKEWSKSPKWNHFVYGHLKHFFDEEEGWYRFGASYTANRNAGNWGLQGGLVTEFTFDNRIEDFWELRPWLGVSLTNKISQKMRLIQFFKFEWRNLFFAEDKTKITTRTRYKLMPIYNFDNNWSVYTSYEWYILPNKNLGARFVNSREWNLGVTKRFKKLSINLNYTRERFNVVLLPDSFEANTIGVTFIF